MAALIARIQSMEFRFHFGLALDNGVQPAELSEIIIHLAFYAGWGNAMAAIAAAKDIFLERGIHVDQLPPAKGKLLPLNEETEKQRAMQVAGNFGTVAPGLVQANPMVRILMATCLRPLTSAGGPIWTSSSWR